MENVFDVSQPPEVLPVDLPVLFSASPKGGGHQGPEGDEGRGPRRILGDCSTEVTKTTLANRCGTPANDGARATGLTEHEADHRELGGLGHPGLSVVEAEISRELPSPSDVDDDGVIGDLGGDLPSQRPRRRVRDGGNFENQRRFGLGSSGGVFEELEACMRVLEHLRPKALVFNLYSAFGYHLAEALGIPCACVSPGVAPSSGAVPLRRVLPSSVLHRLDQAYASSGDQITREDLELWMLPLFMSHYDSWRSRRGLRAPPLQPSGPLPCAPLTLFGVSSTMLPRPGYWPSKAHVCGFWSFDEVSPDYRPPERLVRFLERSKLARKPVFSVGLGSMPGLGLVQDARELLLMVTSCLVEAGVAVVLSPMEPSRGNPEFTRECVLPRSGDGGKESGETKAAIAASEHGGLHPAMSSPDVFQLAAAGDESFVPHSWLLPRCRGIVHHGGSGTTGAALRAGVVQMVIPVAFDQFFFADKVEHIGVGTRVPGTLSTPCRRHVGDTNYLTPSPEATPVQVGGITREGVRSALAAALSDGCRAQAGSYRLLVEEEARQEGVEWACATLASEFFGSDLGR